MICNVFFIGGDMKKILFTGARSGLINKVIDEIKNDYFIYLTVRTEKQLENMIEKYKNFSNVIPLKLDITNKKDVDNILKYDIDILVCNSAIGYGGSILEIPFDKVRENYEVNVFANFELIQKILKKMLYKGNGKIIIMSSLASIFPIPFLGSYCSSKASISSLASSLKKEIKMLNKNIKIKLIEPGLFRTGFNEVMSDNKYDLNESYFDKVKDNILKKENFILNVIAKRKYSSITKKIINAIKSDDNKFIYRAPFSHVFVSKFYQIFFM